GVSMIPGWIEFTRIPNGPSSRAAPFVMPRTAHLLAPYAKHGAEPLNPAIDEMLMIEPDRCAFIDGATACMPRNTPVWLIAIPRFHASSSVSVIDAQWKMPALFTSTSTWP